MDTREVTVGKASTEKDNTYVSNEQNCASNGEINSLPNLNTYNSKQNVTQNFLLQTPSFLSASEHNDGYTINVVSGSKLKEEYTFYHKCNDYMPGGNTMAKNKVSRKLSLR